MGGGLVGKFYLDFEGTETPYPNTRPLLRPILPILREYVSCLLFFELVIPGSHFHPILVLLVIFALNLHFCQVLKQSHIILEKPQHIDNISDGLNRGGDLVDASRFGHAALLSFEGRAVFTRRRYFSEFGPRCRRHQLRHHGQLLVSFLLCGRHKIQRTLDCPAYPLPRHQLSFVGGLLKRRVK